MLKLPFNDILYVGVTFQGFILWGICRAYPSFFFHQLNHPEAAIKLDQTQQSWIASYVSLLSPLGSIIGGTCMDQIGRRHTLKLIYLPFILSWIILAFTKNVTLFYIAFLSQGIGIGMASSLPIYVSEITTPNCRGMLFAVTETTYNLGVLLSNYLMYNLSWDTVALIFAIFSTICLILNSFLPESPIWLYLKGDKKKSIETLCFLRCSTEDKLDTEILQLESFCSSKKKTNIKESLRHCIKAWKQLVIVNIFFTLTESNGYIIMIVFIIQIIDKLNIPFDVTQITVNYSLIGVLSSFVVPFIFLKFNRKTILIVSSFGMGFSMMAVAFYQAIDVNPTFSWIIPLALYFYNFSANVGMLPMSFTIGGELYPNEFRGLLNGISGTLGFLYIAFIQKIFPYYLIHFGVEISILTFSGVSFLTMLFAIFVLPETQGKTLNQIQEEYFRKKPTTIE